MAETCSSLLNSSLSWLILRCLLFQKQLYNISKMCPLLSSNMAKAISGLHLYCLDCYCVLSLYLINTGVSLYSFRRLLERYFMQTIAWVISDLYQLSLFCWLSAFHGYSIFLLFIKMCVILLQIRRWSQSPLVAFQTRPLQSSHSNMVISMMLPTLGDRGMWQLLGHGLSQTFPKICLCVNTVWQSKELILHFYAWFRARLLH